MRRMLLFFTVALAVVSLSSCISTSSYQRAQTLDPGDSETGIALTSTKVSLDGESEFFEDINYIVPEAFYRIGLFKNFEAGVKVYPFSFVVDGKYQFMDTKDGWDIAADLGIGYSSFSIDVNTTDGDDESTTTIFDFYPAALFTYNFSKSFSVTFSPKVILRSVSGNDDSDFFSFFGGSTTLSIGKKNRIIPEVSYYIADDVSYLSFGLGFAF